MGRNKCIGVGAVYCMQCGKFFDDIRLTNTANFHECKKHKGKVGYNLLHRLEREEKWIKEHTN